jgi:hypothetical protein
MVKIATLSTFENSADVVVRLWKQTGRLKLLRFEGFDGVGKTGLAKLVASRIDATHIDGDRFAFKPDLPKPYWECLRREELERAIKEALASERPVILDAVSRLGRAKVALGTRFCRLREAVVVQ